MICIDLSPTPDSYLLLCPWCGDCWCRITGSITDHWWHRYVPCRDHPQACHAYAIDFAGSILEATEVLDSLPPALIKREFDIYITKETYE